MIGTCRFCNFSGELLIEPPTNSIHGNKISCPTCSRFLFWEPKTHNINHRRSLKAGTTVEVWDFYGNRCAFCGVSKENLFALGAEISVHHIPPHVINGDEADLIPLCCWCHEAATLSMKRMRKLLETMKMDF